MAMPSIVGYFIAVLTIISLLAGRAQAVVIEESVTPASVKEQGGAFSVTAEKGKDGLIHFTIIYRLAQPKYLVAHFQVREDGLTLAETDTPAFVHEQSATYHVAVSPAHLAGAKFDLSENGFANSGGQPVALPGGAIYHIDLGAFGKECT